MKKSPIILLHKDELKDIGVEVKSVTGLDKSIQFAHRDAVRLSIPCKFSIWASCFQHFPLIKAIKPTFDKPPLYQQGIIYLHLFLLRS